MPISAITSTNVQPKKKNVLRNMCYSGLGISAAVGVMNGIAGANSERAYQSDVIKNPRKYLEPLYDKIRNIENEIATYTMPAELKSNYQSIVDTTKEQIKNIKSFVFNGKIDEKMIKAAGIARGTAAFAITAALCAIPIGIVALVKACKDA